MAMVPFVEKCPALAHTETRSATVLNDPHVPSGEYGFLESYCDELDCDCRRVFINVVSRDYPGRIMATIGYGWENAAFYRNWASYELSPDELNDLQGPALALGNHQSELAPALLRLFKTILQDRAYEARLRRHYRLFKQAVRAEHFTRSRPVVMGTPARQPGARFAANRNALCPCGSGKKYKHCHGKSGV